MNRILILLALTAMPALAESNSAGRYQLMQLGTMRRDQYLLDTQTGRIWQSTCYYSKSDTGNDCDVQGFGEVTVIKTDKDFTSILEQIKYLKNKEKNKSEN